MKVLTEVRDMQALATGWRQQNLRIGVVPTMGFLHAGHLSLIREAVRRSDRTVVTIFVNPTQFAPTEDYEAYPRDLDRDLDLCEKEGVAAVFTPAAENFYASDHSTWVEETALTGGLCGASRPDHFRGVVTVVAKLFNATLPDIAVFGRKDAQQACVVQRMVRDLNFPVQVVVAPIVREADGLAMSSRNARLNAAQRERALALSRGLQAARAEAQNGETSAVELIAAVRKPLLEADAEIDYIALVDVESLLPVKDITRPALLAVAAKIGAVRLIDNCTLETPE